MCVSDRSSISEPTKLKQVTHYFHSSHPPLSVSLSLLFFPQKPSLCPHSPLPFFLQSWHFLSRFLSNALLFGFPASLSPSHPFSLLSYIQEGCLLCCLSASMFLSLTPSLLVYVSAVSLCPSLSLSCHHTSIIKAKVTKQATFWLHSPVQGIHTQTHSDLSVYPGSCMSQL